MLHHFQAEVDRNHRSVMVEQYWSDRNKEVAMLIKVEQLWWPG